MDMTPKMESWQIARAEFEGAGCLRIDWIVTITVPWPVLEAGEIGTFRMRARRFHYAERIASPSQEVVHAVWGIWNRDLVLRP